MEWADCLVIDIDAAFARGRVRQTLAVSGYGNLEREKSK